MKQQIVKRFRTLRVDPMLGRVVVHHLLRFNDRKLFGHRRGLVILEHFEASQETDGSWEWVLQFRVQARRVLKGATRSWDMFHLSDLNKLLKTFTELDKRCRRKNTSLN